MTAPPSQFRDDRGFTLVEMLVTIVTGMVVILATLSVLDISISQSSRITERVDANQRGRLAMEKILLELHSSCIALGTTAVETGSTDKTIKFISQTGEQAYFTQVAKHEISLNTETGSLTDASYLSNNKLEPGETTNNWTFASTPTSTQVLLTGATQTPEGTNPTPVTPVFRYYKYEGGNLSGTPLNIPLSKADAEETAKVTVSFTAAPSATTYHASAGTKGDRSVDLSDSVVLRFDPASATGGNEPCA